LPDNANLPVLDRDGKTVRIDSNRDYQRVYDNWLWRGVLPVRALGGRGKERRTLRFVICGLELNIALKARVRSVQGGLTVFAIQEIDRHRRLLASLARDMPVLV
jgi:hypothetical protein